MAIKRANQPTLGSKRFNHAESANGDHSVSSWPAQYHSLLEYRCQSNKKLNAALGRRLYFTYLDRNNAMCIHAIGENRLRQRHNERKKNTSNEKQK